MKNLIRRLIIPVLIFFLFSPAKATHIVGGDIEVQSLGSNNFQVTLTLFFDCINGSPAAFDPSITIGVYDKVTNVMQQATVVNFTDSVTLVLGDSCFIPTTLCVRKQRYIGILNIPNNPNGYYMSWSRCCRNGIITNIVNPGASGNVFYCEIPDPALQDNSPVFTSYPDAYMCVGFPNTDNFSAIDPDGDSLVYSLVDPFDCATTGICSSVNPLPPNPPAQPGPYGIVPWQAPYASANMMGDPGQMISNPSGILFTNPPSLGLFVISVLVEEFRNSVKIGAIKRDVQYSVLNCNIPNVTVNGPNPICLGQSTTLSASGGTSYSWSTGATSTSIVVSPTSVGSYDYYVTTSNGSCIAKDSINILVAPNVVVTATTADDTVCVGNSTTLNANVSGGGGYQWSPATGLSCTNCQNPVASPSTTTTYTIVSSNGFGCADTDAVTVVAINSTVNVTGNNLLCLGQSTTLTASGSTSYSWNTGATTSSIVVSPTSTGNYNIVVSTGVGMCLAKDSITVSVGPNVSVTAATVDDTVCIGNSTTLTANATGGTNYLWSPSTGLSCTTCANPVATPTATTTYTIVASNTLGCADTANITIVAMNYFVPAITGPTPLCLGQSTTLTASGGINYSWSNGATTVSIVLTPAVAGTYTYTVTSGNTPCLSTASFVLTVNPLAVATASASNDTICSGTSVLLSAGGGNTYSWNTGATTSAITVNPVSSSTYTVIVNPTTCPDIATVTVVVLPAPSVTAGGGAIICLGQDSTHLNATSSPGVTYSWTPGNGLSCTTCPNPWANPSFSQTYTIYVTNVSGCTGSDVVAVNVATIPVVAAIGSTTICPGYPATLNANANNGTAPYSFYWSPPNDLNNPNSQNPIADPVLTTIYTVTVTDANGCTNDTSTTIYVGTEPTAAIAPWTPTLSCDGYVIPLGTNGSSNAVSYYWNFGDGTNSTEQNPIHAYSFNGTYVITLVVFNPPCRDSMDTTINVGDMSGFINVLPANVFTPNGDNMNDCFHPAITPNNANITPDIIDTLTGCITLEVYDRWGIKMFESSDTKKCWDGKTKNGQQANDGTYYYIATFGELNLRGFVTLLRKK